ncbi:hypothetical protein ACEPAH_1319 [Sanghuangporus vaninii]
MQVRILTDNGDQADFEFDVECSRLTPDIKRTVQELISKETGIQPEKQIVVFLPKLPGAKDIKKLTLPSDTELLASVPVYQNAHLGKLYPEISDQSTIYVRRIGNWREDDLRKPENRMKIIRVIGRAGIFLRTLYRELNRPRTVDTSLLDQFPDFRDHMKRDLTDFLTPSASATSDVNVTPIELRCYVDILFNILDGVEKFESRQFVSSPPHMLFFGSMMIQPPFFWDKYMSLKKLEIATGHTPGLGMFVRTNDQSDVYKFAPRSDLAVLEKSSSLPALICEVDSHVLRKNGTEMVFRGAVWCRQWRYVLPEVLKEKNMVLGLFIHKYFDIDVYLFHADNSYNVEIFQQRVYLGNPNEALQLARILFNYRDKFLDIAGLSEREKIQSLDKLVSDSKVLPSLTTSKSVSSRDSRQSSKQPTYARESETRTTPLLLSESVKSLLCPDGAHLRATEHESVASVRTVGIPSKTLGFVKLTNKHELRAFDTIRNSGSELLLSRVVFPTNVIELSGYLVAFLPYGGEPLRHSWGLQDGPVGHETEIAWDLLTIISRLHDLHIAHLDIKPANILWDITTRSIRLIDFDSSEKLDPNGSGKIRGIFGTSGYAASEVESGKGHEYDPFLADAFSCGKVLSDVVMAERMTEEAEFVLELSQCLNKADVRDRWSVNTAIKVWVDWLKERGRPEYDR